MKAKLKQVLKDMIHRTAKYTKWNNKPRRFNFRQRITPPPPTGTTSPTMPGYNMDDFSSNSDGPTTVKYTQKNQKTQFREKNSRRRRRRNKKP